MATTAYNGILKAADADRLYSYPNLSNNDNQWLNGKGEWTSPNKAYTAVSRTNQNQKPAFGGTFTIKEATSDATGHVTGTVDQTVTIPNSAATTTAAGLMSADDKKFLASLLAGTLKTPTINTTTGSLEYKYNNVVILEIPVAGTR